jgi:broad specificity phosphatase PhoE
MSKLQTAEVILRHHGDLKLSLTEKLRERVIDISSSDKYHSNDTKFMGALQGERWHPGIKLPPDVETGPSFVERILNWWDNLLDLGMHCQGDQESVALVISHGAWIGFLLQHLSEDRGYEVLQDANHGPTKKSWFIENASLQLIRVSEVEGTVRGTILKWGDNQHLKEIELVAGNADLADWSYNQISSEPTTSRKH